MNRIAWIAACAILLGGCKSKNFLEQRTTPDRAEFGDETIAVPPAPLPHVDIVNADPSGAGGTMSTQIAGTWTFTMPPTVTRVEKKNGEIDQYSLYNGRPGPTDTPFVVITVSHDRKGIAESDSTYKISAQRDYSMNGALVHEWTGMTAAGAGFSELLLRKPGPAGETGDVCHAMALARSEEEQKLALRILASIVWKPALNQSASASHPEPMVTKLREIKVSYALVMREDGILYCATPDGDNVAQVSKTQIQTH